MAAFAPAQSSVGFPTLYRDAVPGLRLRIFDQNENEVPESVESVEVGDDLRAVVTWRTSVVPVDMSREWGVSMDELVATATKNVHELPLQRKALNDGEPGPVVATVGHHWTSSLITSLDDDAKGPEGAIVAIPRADVMLLCDEIYDRADAGVSSHVWWSWHDGLYRITDRRRDRDVDIEPSMSVSAFHFVGALEHLVNPFEECGPTSPA
jgi:hypothetical protein